MLYVSSLAKQLGIQRSFCNLQDTHVKKEIARRERQRLKAMEKHKKDALEKLREDQNLETADGEVYSGIFVLKRILQVLEAERHLVVLIPPFNVRKQEERGKKRLAFLLKQAEVFQHFSAQPAPTEKK